MKSDPRVIAALNDVLAGELTAINQYFLHGRMALSWGFDKLGNTIYQHSIGEMKHASDLTDRILLLEGIPNLQKLGKLNIGETIEEMFAADLALEYDAIDCIRKGVTLCREVNDPVSRELLERTLQDEENHIDWIKTQQGLIQSIGMQNYLAKQIT